MSSGNPSSPQRARALALAGLFAGADDHDNNAVRIPGAKYSCEAAGGATVVEAQPAEKLGDIRQFLARCFGPYERVDVDDGGDDDGDSAALRVVFRRGVVSAKFSGDGPSVCFGLPAFDLDEVVAVVEAWPGEHHLLVCEDGAAIAELEPDRALAVLAAVAAQIGGADAPRWRDIVDLDPKNKSLPSGILQDWEAGSPLTLHTLATLMISISDNTAADALLRLAGREAVEAFAWRNRPFLSTRELFILKESAPLRERFRGLAGDEARRRAFLDEEVDAAPLPNADFDWEDPLALDVEWFFSARELRENMDRVRDLPLMGVNPTGIVKREEWARMAYKGGSEPGVLNLTFFLEALSGKKFHIVLTVNDKNAPLNELALIALVYIIIENLKLR